MADDVIPTEWLRAVLPMAVLAAVAEEETYGYAVAQRLADAGLGAVKGGTLYPVLNRLESDGFVVSSWRAGVAGPGRKFFAVTDAGVDHLRRRSAEWHDFTQRAARLLADPRRTR